jgi:hypothetical protein
VSPSFKDPNFINLSKDVESIYAGIINRELGSTRDPVDIDNEVKSQVEDRVDVEFLERLLFHQHLLDNNLALEPKEFFRAQTAFGASIIGDLVNRVRDYHVRTIRAMLSQVQSSIRNHFYPRRLGVVIALDEAQVAANGVLAGKLISPSALIKNRNILFDDKTRSSPSFVVAFSLHYLRLSTT